MNPIKEIEISTVVESGLNRWRMVPNAHVSFLTDPNEPDLRVPRVIVTSRAGFMPHSPVVVCITDMHAEESSGHHVFSNPDQVLPIIQPHLDRYSFVIYPQVNHHGPQFIDAFGNMRSGYQQTSIKEADKLTRYDKNGINYNDGWGEVFPTDRKTREGALIEHDTNNFMSRHTVVAGFSAHEDSSAPHQGYIWANEQPFVRQIPKIKRAIESGWYGSLVSPFASYQDTEIEWAGFVAVDMRDPGSWETFMNDQGVPTVLSEAPFGDPLATRLNFHQRVLSGTLEALIK